MFYVEKAFISLYIISSKVIILIINFHSRNFALKKTSRQVTIAGVTLHSHVMCLVAVKNTWAYMALTPLLPPITPFILVQLLLLQSVIKLMTCYNNFDCTSLIQDELQIGPGVVCSSAVSNNYILICRE